MQAYFIAVLVTFLVVTLWVLIEKAGEAFSRRHPECPARRADCGAACIEAGRCLSLAPKINETRES